MGSILICRLDDETKRRLRTRAARNGHSMEQEAREILRTSLACNLRKSEHFVDAIRRRIAPFGGVDLPLIPRGPIPKLSGIFEMAGAGREIFGGEHPDEYVRRLREGWG